MSNKLQNVLDEIKLEKDTYLLPENIKKDVQIFDVVGTLEEGGASTDVPVKLFETQEEMQADETAEEGDLAVVYRSEIQNWDGTSAVTSFTFPQTVVLPSAMTGSCYGYASGSSYIDIDGSVSATSASFRIRSDSSYRVTYTSEDGLTYTRTDSYDETIAVSEEEVTIQMYEFSEVCGYFMRIGGNTFEGLFECFSVDNIKYPFLNLIVPDGTNTFKKSSKPFDFSNLDFSDLSNYVVVVSTYEESDMMFIPKNFTIYDSLCGMSVGFNTSLNLAFVYAGTYNDYASVFEIRKRVYVNGELTDTVTMTNDSNTPDICFTGYTSYRYLEILENSYVFMNDTSYLKFDNCSDMTSLPITLTVTYGPSGTGYDWSQTYEKMLSYLYTKTQFTLTNGNQLFPNILAYGKNGVVVGDDSTFDWSNIPVSLTKNYFGIADWNGQLKTYASKELPSVGVFTNTNTEIGSTPDSIYLTENDFAILQAKYPDVNVGDTFADDYWYVVSTATDPLYMLQNTENLPYCYYWSDNSSTYTYIMFTDRFLENKTFTRIPYSYPYRTLRGNNQFIRFINTEVTIVDTDDNIHTLDGFSIGGTSQLCNAMFCENMQYLYFGINGGILIIDLVNYTLTQYTDQTSPRMIGYIPGTNNIIYARGTTIYTATPAGVFTQIGTVDTGYTSDDNYWAFADFSRVETENCVVYVSRKGKALKYNLTTNTIEYAYTSVPSSGMITGIFEYNGNESYVVWHNGLKQYQIDIDWTTHTITYTVTSISKVVYGKQISSNGLIQGPNILPVGKYFMAKIDESTYYGIYRLISIIESDYTNTVTPEEYTEALNTVDEILGEEV